MTATLAPETIEAAYIAACRLEVRALKPGNVHIYSDGHGMKVRDFELSAEVSAPFIAESTLSVGEKVRRSVDATFAAVGCNTNLGILLLCAPLAAAASNFHPIPSPLVGEGQGGGKFQIPPSRPPPTPTPSPQGGGETHEVPPLQRRISAVLAQLDENDARNVYAAIAHANPGGLGAAPNHDVRSPPASGLTLGQAMAPAADRDLIARQYATGFRDVFASAAALEAAMRRRTREQAVTEVFLDLLQREPDTHIARKFGTHTAADVCRRTRQFVERHKPGLAQAPFAADTLNALLSFDKELKNDGLNPGSLADLIAAAAFAVQLLEHWPRD